MKTFSELREAKATYCGRCGTTHVPPSKGGTCPALSKEESVNTADKKPETYKDPATGKMKTRMVPTDKEVVKEKTLTPAEKKKREEIARAMERENPGMDMSKKMAIATAAAKRVAEAKKEYAPGHIGAIQRMLDKEREAKKAKDAIKKEEAELDEVASETPHPQTHVMASAAGSNDVHLWKHIDGKATPVKRNLTTAEAGKLQRNHGIKWVRHGAQKYFNDLKKNEEVELDEGITKMSNARLKYHATKNFPHGSYTRKEIEDEHKRRQKTEPNYHTVKPALESKE